MAPTRNLRTADFSEGARRKLGEAVAEARRRAGFRWRTDMARAHPEVSVSSLKLIEQAKPLVGITALQAVGEALGAHFPGQWSKDTPRAILEGGPIPDLTAAPAATEPRPTTDEPEFELPAIYRAGDFDLMAIVQDRRKLGSVEYFEALGILFADGKIPKEVYLYAMAVGRKVRKARAAAEEAAREADREIADLQKSLTDRVRSDLSG